MAPVPRRVPAMWILRAGMLTFLATFGGERPGATFRAGAGRGTPFQCPVCHWAEYSRLTAPKCSGTPEEPHARTIAQRIDFLDASKALAPPQRFR